MPPSIGMFVLLQWEVLDRVLPVKVFLQAPLRLSEA